MTEGTTSDAAEGADTLTRLEQEGEIAADYLEGLLDIADLEQKWPTGKARPSYLIDEPIEEVPGLVMAFGSLRPRILGLRPHRDESSRTAYDAFLTTYAQRFGGNSKPPVLPRYEVISPALVRLCRTLERNCSGQSTAAARPARLARVPGAAAAR